MKKINILLLMFCMSLMACQKEEVPTYDDLTADRYISTVKSYRDSSDFSFVPYPGQVEYSFPIAVRSTGAGLVDEYYRFEVDTERTTAEALMYEVPEKSVMRAGQEVDTCWIKLKYVASMDTAKVRLVVKLVETEDFKLGQSSYREHVIWFHNFIKQPAWWDNSVKGNYFGNYTEAKYRAMLNFFGKDLFDGPPADLSLARQYALEFKAYLKERKEAGNPLLEANGTEMEVPILGNFI